MGSIRTSKVTKDEGYSWVIVIGSFLSHFSNIGFSFGIAGNLTVAHQKFFKVDLQEASIVGSVHICTLFLFGPVTSVLVRKLGCRFTEMFGGFLLIAGVGLSVFSREIWHAIVLYGFLAGSGVSCSYTASSQILAVYFDRLKYLAFSLAIFGFYIGMVTWPLLSEFLFTKFGYSYAMAIMAGAHLLHLLAGMSFLEPREDSHKEKISETKMVKGKSSEFENEDIAKENGSELFESDEICPEETDESSHESLKTTFFNLLKSWKVRLLMISGMLWSSNDSGFLILVNSYVIHDTEMDANEAAFGVTVTGLANMVGCLSVALTSSLKFNRFILYCCAMIFFGAAAIVTSFSSSKEMYYGLLACWGLGESVIIACLLGVVSDLCTVNQIPILLGLELMAEGIGGITLVPLAAKIGETTDERYGIIFVGCCGLLGALAILPVVIFNTVKEKKGYSNLL